MRLVAVIALLLLAGGAAFAIARDAGSDDAPVEAQSSPDTSAVTPVLTPGPGAQVSPDPFAGTPVYTLDPMGTPFPADTPVYIAGPDGTPVILIPRAPHPALAANMTAVAEDRQKPSFTGELNGIRFLGDGTPVPPGPIACANNELTQLFGEAEIEQAIQSSNIGFEVTWLPEGMAATEQQVVLCHGEVVTISLTFETEVEAADLRSLYVGRIRGEPVTFYPAPRDRLQPMTINGRPSVLITPLPLGPTFLFMRDDQGTLWTISGDELGEVLQFAEGIESAR